MNYIPYSQVVWRKALKIGFFSVCIFMCWMLKIDFIIPEMTGFYQFICFAVATPKFRVTICNYQFTRRKIVKSQYFDQNIKPEYIPDDIFQCNILKLLSFSQFFPQYFAEGRFAGKSAVVSLLVWQQTSHKCHRSAQSITSSPEWTSHCMYIKQSHKHFSLQLGNINLRYLVRICI